MSLDHFSWSGTESTLIPMILQLRLSNSGFSPAMYPSSVVHTGVKFFGCENRMAQPLPIQSWKLILPWVVSAVKFGASLLIRNDIPSPPYREDARGQRHCRVLTPPIGARPSRHNQDSSSSIDGGQGRPPRRSHHQVRYQFLALGLGTQQQRQDEADGAHHGAHQHGDAEPQLVVDGEVREHRGNQATEDRSLMITEGARRCPDLGGEALREIARILPVECVAEQALKDEADHDEAQIVREQV